MVAINTTGKPRTEDYNLGRGKVYLAALDSNGLPDGNGWRDVGNATEFNLSIEVERLEHTSSREGLATVDKEVVISQQLSVSLTLDEINADNAALFFSGETASHTNPAVAGISKITDFVPAVKLGRWYDIKTTAYGASTPGERAYDIQKSADVTLEEGTTPTTLVEGTDYELDLKQGRFFLLSTATNIADGEDLDMTLAANGSASATMDETRGLTKSAVTAALKFVAENPANNDAEAEYTVHKVSLSAEGDFSAIGDEFTTMQVTGSAEKNETADSASPTLTIRCKPNS